MNKISFSLIALLVGLLSSPAWGETAEATPIVKGIRVFTAGEDFGVEITADSDLVYSCTKIPPLLKIIVDLPLTDPGRPDSDYQVGSALISTIRLEKKSINDVLVSRIAINLAEDADYTAVLDPADKRKLTLTLRRIATGPATTAPTAVSTALLPSSAVKTVQTAPPQPKAQPPQELKPSTAAPPPAIAPPPVAVTKPVVPASGQTAVVNEVRFSATAIDIQIDGAVGEFRAFALLEPGRLVIDIPAARSKLDTIVVPANHFGVIAARSGSFEGKLRLVFDTGSKPFPRFRVEKTATGLRVLAKKET